MNGAVIRKKDVRSLRNDKSLTKGPERSRRMASESREKCSHLVIMYVPQGTYLYNIPND
jgi:hypothetical protein